MSQNTFSTFNTINTSSGSCPGLGPAMNTSGINYTSGYVASGSTVPCAVCGAVVPDHDATELEPVTQPGGFTYTVGGLGATSQYAARRWICHNCLPAHLRPQRATPWQWNWEPPEPEPPLDPAEVQKMRDDLRDLEAELR
jgi:hypothetical protein